MDGLGDVFTEDAVLELEGPGPVDRRRVPRPAGDHRRLLRQGRPARRGPPGSTTAMTGHLSTNMRIDLDGDDRDDARLLLRDRRRLRWRCSARTSTACAGTRTAGDSRSCGSSCAIGPGSRPRASLAGRSPTSSPRTSAASPASAIRVWQGGFPDLRHSDDRPHSDERGWRARASKPARRRAPSGGGSSGVRVAGGWGRAARAAADRRQPRRCSRCPEHQRRRVVGTSSSASPRATWASRSPVSTDSTRRRARRRMPPRRSSSGGRRRTLGLQEFADVLLRHVVGDLKARGVPEVTWTHGSLGAAGLFDSGLWIINGRHHQVQRQRQGEAGR